MSRRYAHRIPFIVKVNHNELLTYPTTYDQVQFGSGPTGLGPRCRWYRRHDLLRFR